MKAENVEKIEELVKQIGKDVIMNHLNKPTEQPTEPVKTKEEEMEEFFLECLNGLTFVKNGEWTEYHKNGEWWFAQNSKYEYTYVSYKCIWSVFKSRFNLNYNETRDFIKGRLEKHTNWSVKTTKHK